MKNILISAGVAVLVVVLGFVFFAPVQKPVGATAGNDFYNQVNFGGGVVNSRIVATTSQGAAITVKASEFTDWANGSLVEFKQGLVTAVTLTFPASSTVASLVPHPGDRQTFCIRNATSTSALTVILAGSTGINLNVASSTATASAGSAALTTGEVGCVTLVRQSATATTFDIDALLTVFK